MSHPKEHNEVMLTRELLLVVLHHLAARILKSFGHTVRLVVHGGAVMVLHPRLASRPSTRDVDYNHRSFEVEWRNRGVHDATIRLNACIAATAKKFNLGADWMNAQADVSLPFARDTYGNLYDPIWTDAMTPDNVRINTIFACPGLELVGVSWSWAVALKLVRYKKHDPYDIAHILHLGQKQKGVQWTPQLLEGWLTTMCGNGMGYAAYSSTQMEGVRNKMRHAVGLVENSRANSPFYL
ncbi:hypothetical protein OBBRIDRAFT_486551 [Obba rivulosa]|uniref:Uncharacterized protein n=1 Tax=Obba rivulosa TaxID=1052685 RepID=A0A8E2B1L9_9APHY|nr:hypothetical protein OBBRIDRAFT_486551 [Obba rivulosa]